VNASGEAVRGLVKSRVEFPRGLRQQGNTATPPLTRLRLQPATQAKAVNIQMKAIEYTLCGTVYIAVQGCSNFQACG